jgi:hypothetical protein
MMIIDGSERIIWYMQIMLISRMGGDMSKI